MTLVRRHISIRVGAWLRALRAAAVTRNLLCALLLFAAGIDLGAPWVAMAIANNEICSCCHRKGAACYCRRMHHGPGWQDRSECCANGCGAHGLNISGAFWAPPAQTQFSLFPARAESWIPAYRSAAWSLGFSLRQRPPPAHWF